MTNISSLRVGSLRDLFKQKGINAYIVPSTDPHLSEYVADHWKSREWISGFTGSAGTVVITSDKAGLWTDSRYFLQAADQLQDSCITLYKDILATVLAANVTNDSETSKPCFSRKPGESIFDYASRVSEDVDRSVRERVSARDDYEKKVKSKGFQTKEALQNSMLGLQEFMSAIDRASGNKRYIEDIPDFENPILGENRLSSVNKEESHSRLDAVHSPMPTKGVRKPYLRSYTMIYMPLADIFFPRMYQAPDGFMAVRIALMYYVDFYSLFNNPEKEWDIILSKAFDAPSEPSLFD